MSVREVIAVISGGWSALVDVIARRRRPPTCTITSVATIGPPSAVILSVAVS